MAKRKKRVNPILEARRLEARRAAGGEAQIESRRASGSSTNRTDHRRRKNKKKQGLRLYAWVNVFVGVYLIALLSYIFWTQGDAFPIEDLAVSSVTLLLISSVVIAIPTLLVWIFSHSQKASNFTCIAAVCLLSLFIFPRAFLTPSAPQENAAAISASGPDQASDKLADQSALNQGFFAIKEAIADVGQLAKRWENDSAAYARAGAYDPRTLRGQYATDSRILELQNLIRLTQQFKTAYALQEQAIGEALAPIDLTDQERSELLTAWRNAATPELFDESRSHDLVVLDGHLQLLGLIKQYPEWTVRSDGYMIFVNHPEVSDRYHEIRAKVINGTQVMRDYQKQIVEQRKLSDQKYNP